MRSVEIKDFEEKILVGNIFHGKKSFKLIRKIFVCLSFLILNLNSFSQRFEQYFVAPDDSSRWNIPGPEEEVKGEQNFWYVSTHEAKLGGFRCSRKSNTEILNFSDSCFEFQINNAWADYNFLVTALGPTTDSIPVPETQNINISNITWGTIPNVPIDKGLIFTGYITELIDGDTGFYAILNFKDGAIPVKVEVLSEVPKKLYPDIFAKGYGPHWQHAYDVYYPDNFDPQTDHLRACILFIHGGGWGAFSKSNVKADSWLDSGYVVIATNYRLVSEYQEAPEMNLPVAAALLDAARALQHIKYNSTSLGIDPNRICLIGSSAGGASSSWLATVDSIGTYKSYDPISNVSTRVACAIPTTAQTSLDPHQMRTWIPSIDYGDHAFFTSADPDYKAASDKFQYYYDHRDDILTEILDFSAYHQVSSDDPPILFDYGPQENVIPALSETNATHHPMFGVEMYDHMKTTGVEDCFYYSKNEKDERSGGYAEYKGKLQFTYDYMGGAYIYDTLSPNAPSNVMALNIGETTVDLMWNKSLDNVGVVGYIVYKGVDSVAFTLDTAICITGLDPDTDYNFYLSAFDASKNASLKSNVSFKTLGGGVNEQDTIPPSQPKNLIAQFLTDSSFTLCWDHSTDNIGVVEYEVFKDGNSVEKTSDTSLYISGLIYSTTYSMTVIAIDSAANLSIASQIFNVTTKEYIDNDPPTIPNDLKITDTLSNSIILSWSHSEDNVQVSSYTLVVNGDSTTSLNDTIFTLSGLLDNETYEIQVYSNDAFGNSSGLSNTVVFKNIITTSINNELRKQCIIYPNPVQNQLFLNYEFTGEVNVSIISITGQQIYSQLHCDKNQSIDVSNFNNGIYLIKIEKGNSFSQAVFIKE